MSFSEFDACSPTLAVARFKRYKRRILTPKKHAHTTPIAVLKNTPQNVAYLWPIQYIIEKDSNSSDFFHELAALPVKVREGLVKALSEKSPTWFTYCTSMRPSGLRYTWARLLLPAGVTLSRSEGSVVLGIEMLRGVYPECNEWAQHDGMVTPAALSPSESVRLSSPQRILMGHFLG